jgi:hypothetical protein
MEMYKRRFVHIITSMKMLKYRDVIPEIKINELDIYINNEYV